jgi:hypothetical protein
MCNVVGSKVVGKVGKVRSARLGSLSCLIYSTSAMVIVEASLFLSFAGAAVVGDCRYMDVTYDQSVSDCGGGQ